MKLTLPTQSPVGAIRRGVFLRGCGYTRPMTRESETAKRNTTLAASARGSDRLVGFWLLAAAVLLPASFVLIMHWPLATILLTIAGYKYSWGIPGQGSVFKKMLQIFYTKLCLERCRLSF